MTDQFTRVTTSNHDAFIPDGYWLCNRCGGRVELGIVNLASHFHFCPGAVAQQVEDGTITPEQGIAKLTQADSPIFIDGDFNPDSYENRIRRSKGKGRQHPSVSPGVGGEVRQRRTPKPGIPHFSIRWQPRTGYPIFTPLNNEAVKMMRKYLFNAKCTLYFRGGIIRR